MLKKILAITGKPGLYKLISHGANMLIVESLVDKKRIPAYTRDKLVSLADVSMFTTGDDVPLSEVLTRLGEKEGLKKASFDPKKADNEQLREFFGGVLENFDRDRVYPSDIRKLVTWYNILVEAGITDFSIEEEDTAVAAEEGAANRAEEKKEKKNAANRQVKTQKAAAKASAKTGVGAKKG